MPLRGPIESLVRLFCDEIKSMNFSHFTGCSRLSRTKWELCLSLMTCVSIPALLSQDHTLTSLALRYRQPWEVWRMPEIYQSIKVESLANSLKNAWTMVVRFQHLRTSTVVKIFSLPLNAGTLSPMRHAMRHCWDYLLMVLSYTGAKVRLLDLDLGKFWLCTRHAFKEDLWTYRWHHSGSKLTKECWFIPLHHYPPPCCNPERWSEGL